MAAFSSRPFQKGRRRSLFWALCTCRRAPADLEFYAQEIRGSHLWPRFAYGTGIEIIDLSGADEIKRDYGGDLSRTRRTSLRIPRGTLARNDGGAGKTNARASGEARFRKGG